MVINSFLQANNTLIKNTRVNTGQNPVVELFYGGDKSEFSRYIFKIDIDRIKYLQNDLGVFEDYLNTKHILHMTNTSFFDYENRNKSHFMGKRRASSFKLKLYRLTQDFVEGRGYDQHKILYMHGDSNHTTEPSNYYNATSTTTWETQGAVLNNQTEVFTIQRNPHYRDPMCHSSNDPQYLIPNDELTLIAEQDFDEYNMNLNMDITHYLNAVLLGLIPNYGLCLCFEESLENTISDEPNYVGFFARQTNSIYAPYVQSTEMNVINDSRQNFNVKDNNKLYFYIKENGKYVDPATSPIVSLVYDPDDMENNDNFIQEYTMCNEDNFARVYRQRKGVYYIDVELEEIDGDITCETLYDVWNINLGRRNIKTDMDITLTDTSFESIGLMNSDTRNITFTPKGITSGYKANIDDLTDFYILPKIMYTYGQLAPNIDVNVTIYSKEGNAEVQIFDRVKTDTLSDGSKRLTLDMNSFYPNRYYVDLEAFIDGEVKHIKNFIWFDVVNETNKRINWKNRLETRN